jgi:hypothetical protein
VGCSTYTVQCSWSGADGFARRRSSFPSAELAGGFSLRVIQTRTFLRSICRDAACSVNLLLMRVGSSLNCTEWVWRTYIGMAESCLMSHNRTQMPRGWR